MNNKPYTKYKSSGVEWIGSVPEHWKLSQVKNVCSFEKGQGLSKSTTDITGMNACILYGELFTTYKKTIVIKSVVSRTDENGSILSKGDEILIPGSTTTTGIDLSNAKYLPLKGVILGGDIIILYPKKSLYLQQFLALFLTHVSTPEFIVGANGVTIYHIYPTQIREMFITLPPISEQKKIVLFIDRETAKIDEVTAKKQKMMDLLKEKRQALITHAVTKGLDPKVKMKPSGIDWLGDIPEGWEVKRLRFVIKTNPTKQENKASAPDSEVSFIPMEAVSEDGEIDLSITKTLEEVIDGYTYFRDGDIVIAKITPCFENGKGAIMQHLINGVGFGTTEFHVLRSENIDPQYLYLITRIYPFRTFGEVNMKGAAGQKRVPEEFIKDFALGFPQLPEQRVIANFLDRETAKIDGVVKKVEAQIEKLQEYRQALITSAVTGKIMVN